MLSLFVCSSSRGWLLARGSNEGMREKQSRDASKVRAEVLAKGGVPDLNTGCRAGRKQPWEKQNKSLSLNATQPINGHV